MLLVRKTTIIKEVISYEMGEELATPVTRAAGLAILSNPFSARFVNDLEKLFAAGRDVGNMLAESLVAEFSRPVVSYGKAAIVGLNGEMEHGGACIHPMLGKPMRQAVGGGNPSSLRM